jgi:hypothetical protein
MTRRYLKKSRFKLAAECPRKLLYAGKGAYRDASGDNALLKSLADGGFQVEELAKRLYPNGIEVAETDNSEALARSSALLVMSGRSATTSGQRRRSAVRGRTAW